MASLGGDADCPVFVASGNTSVLFWKEIALVNEHITSNTTKMKPQNWDCASQHKP